MTGMQDAQSYARQIFEQVADEHTDPTDLGLYLARLIAELFELSPGARTHLSDLFFVELTDQLYRAGNQDAVRAVLEVQTLWDQES